MKRKTKLALATVLLFLLAARRGALSIGIEGPPGRGPFVVTPPMAGHLLRAAGDRSTAPPGASIAGRVLDEAGRARRRGAGGRGPAGVDVIDGSPTAAIRPMDAAQPVLVTPIRLDAFRLHRTATRRLPSHRIGPRAVPRRPRRAGAGRRRSADRPGLSTASRGPHAVGDACSIWAVDRSPARGCRSPSMRPSEAMFDAPAAMAVADQQGLTA